MKKLVSILFTLIIFGGLFNQVHATHIVGGELNYELLSGNQYKITLKIYKDCGISVVPFDDPASIYVYDGNNNVIDTLELPIVQRDTLDASFEDTCLIVPPEICVDFAQYEGIFTFPLTANGYTLAYIRCCRNSTIVNAEGIDPSGNPIPPDLIGATYTAVIPGSNLVTTNSNPEFNEFPPIIICSGQNISVDQSAFDKDGDQLVYSLCTPNVGGSLQQVFGNPIVEVPPFEQIIWIDPYNENDVMGGDEPLTINSSTGLLTGIVPNRVGQFVVAVCVQEFRNGILLSENKRDFQFNIADCAKVYDSEFTLVDEPITDTLEIEINDTLFDYVLVCDSNLAVQFESMVEGTQTIAWDFGDGSVISFEENPLHVFPDTGLYFVSLIAEPGNECTDTFKQLVNIQYQEIFADFDSGEPQCYDENVGLQFTDLTEDANQVELWNWNFGDGQTSSIENPIHFYNNDGSYDILLEVEAFNGCRSSYETTILVERLDEFSLEDTIALCLSDTVVLELEIEGNHSFIWSPANSLSNPFIQNPKAFPTENTIYTVQILTIRASGDTCIQIGEIAVLTDQPIPEIEFVIDENQCDSIIELEVQTNNVGSVFWSNNINFNPLLSEETSFQTTQTEAIETYFVKTSNQFCESIDSLEIHQNGIFISGEDVNVCIGNFATLQALVESNDNDVSYKWIVNEDTTRSDVPSFTFLPSFTNEVVLDVENISGCMASHTFQVMVNSLPNIEATANPSTVINAQQIQLEVSQGETYLYSWTPEDILNSASIFNPLAVVTETTSFVVVVKDENGCFNSDTIEVTVVDQLCDEPDIFIPTAFSPNNDQLNDVFKIQGEVIESVILSIYDRWGNVVFETTDLNTTWDGKYEGEQLNNGIFGYSVEINCFGGQQFVKSGSITIVR